MIIFLLWYLYSCLPFFVRLKLPILHYLSDGNYYADGLDMSWVQKMKDVKIVSYAKRDFQDSETRAINKASRDMMLTEYGDAYYRAELEKRLKGHDKSEWDKIIDDYNHTLKIDETGNIIDIYPFEQG